VCSIEAYAGWVTGKISMFGSLAQRGVASDAAQPSSEPKRRIRHVFVAVRTGDKIHERPGVLLDWAQEADGWTARVAYVADEDGTLVVAWVGAAQLTPVPDL
jgi:hypothetical protein